MNAEEPRSASSLSGRKIIIAIDGPAGAGKSTIARHLARHFGLLNLETGAMYRAFALKALRAGLPLDESSALEGLAENTSIRLEPGGDENRVLLDGEDVTTLIRTTAVTDAASRVSVFPSVRAWMVRLQQQVGAGGGVVMEGRDIGTAVFPDAEFKFFLDADPRVRAERRYEELSALGTATNRDEVLRELMERDQRDSGRALAPLRRADDAIVIDTSNLPIDQVVCALKERIQGLYVPKRA
jgi:CMP/dCMP kinase